MKRMKIWGVVRNQNTDEQQKHAVLRYVISCWIPALLLVGLIFYGSSRTYAWAIGAKSLIDVLRLDKVAHVLEYGCLAVCFLRAFRFLLSQRRIAVYVLSIVLPVLLAFSDEFHQSFIPGRHTRLSDVGIDVIGIVAGLVIIDQWRRLKHEC